MHARQRNGPGNGYYRGKAKRMGSVGAASRMSPQGSMRGRGSYDFEYRGNNRGGYGRGGRSRQFRPTMPPPRESDVFLEAGKLAAEYLVSKGVLPPNVFSGKWQGDGFNKQMGGFHGFRPREVENAQTPVVGRASAPSGLGDSALDVEPGIGRYSNEYSSVGTNNSLRGRRTGSFKNYGSEMNRGLGKCGSWAERSKLSTGIDSDSDALSGNHDEQPVGEDGIGCEQNSSPGQKAQEAGNVDHLEPGTEKHISVEDAGANSNSLSNAEHLPSDVNGESAEEPADANNLNASSEAVQEGTNDKDSVQTNSKNNEVIATAMEDSLVSEGPVDLVKHIKFVNVPTRARSSLTIKASKKDKDFVEADASVSESEISKVSGVQAMDVNTEISNGDASSHENHEPNSLQSDLTAPVKEEPNATYTIEQEQRLRSESFSGISLCMGQEPDDSLSGFGHLNSMFTHKNGKRAIDDDTDCREDSKKHKEWTPPMDAQFHGSPSHFDPRGSRLTLPDPAKSSLASVSDDHVISQFTGGHAEFLEEKQLLPGLFKTCDLNLVGNSHVNEIHDIRNPVHVSPTVGKTEKEAEAIDNGLSMSNQCSLPSKNSKDGVTDNGVEIIDLDYESEPENNSFHPSQRREGTLSTDLDGFQKNVLNSDEIPNVQDGYGLMFPEFLGNDLQSQSLLNGEAILGDDDSIYMSLGEIPISLLGAWEQPTQDYGKPF